MGGLTNQYRRKVQMLGSQKEVSTANIHPRTSFLLGSLPPQSVPVDQWLAHGPAHPDWRLPRNLAEAIGRLGQPLR